MSKAVKVFILVVFFLLNPGKNFAQANLVNLDAEIYSSRQGLSQHYIYTILQDYRGFLWFGTKDGLNRFDGYSFKVYRNDPLDSTSLTDNYVLSIYEDKDSNLWIGTASGGLNLFNREKENFTRFPNTVRDPKTHTYLYINTLYRDEEKKIWLGTNGQGLFHFDPGTKKLERIVVSSNGGMPGAKHLHKIYKDLENRLWLTTVDMGLILAEKDKNGYRFTSYIPDGYKPGIEGININKAFQTNNPATGMPDKFLWIGTNKGWKKFFPATGKFFNFLPGIDPMFSMNVWDIIETDDHALWINYANDLIKYYPSSGNYDVIDNTSNPGVNQLLHNTSNLYLDRSGVIWMGTTGYGILRYNPKIERFGKKTNNIRQYLSENVFKLSPEVMKISGGILEPRSIIEEPDSTLWISINGYGVIHYSLKTKKILKNYFNLCRPQELIKDPVYIISNKISPYYGHILKRSNGDLIIGTEKGILIVDPESGSCSYLSVYPELKTPDSRLNNTGYPDITALFEDANEILWLGTPSLGLARMDTDNYSIQFFQYDIRDTNSLSNNAILCIENDPYNSNILWVGTDGGGVNKFNTSTGTFTRIQEGSGLPNNVVYAILKDNNGMLWMSTNKGLTKYNPVNGEFRNYDEKQGLQNNEFNRYEFFRDLSGKFYFGGIGGCNVFNPADLSDNKVIPPVVLTDFKLFNRSVSLKDKNSPLKSSITETRSLKLDYSRNVITFEFAALDFSSPSNNKYAYKLEGFDQDWIYSGTERTATYTNLDPGEYIFRVKASNDDGIWNEKGASVIVTIMPPFWMTWWFRGLIGVIAIAGTILIVLLIERRKVQEKTRRAENEAALERERLRIARDMHDDLGARLTEISIIGDLSLRSSNDQSFRNDIEKITNVARETVSVFDEIVWAVNPRYDRLEHIANYFSRYATEYLASAEIRCRLHIPDELPDIYVAAEARHNILMVLKESLNNLVKHSGAKTAEITIEYNPPFACFVIADDGKGFNTGEEIAFNEGIKSMRNRMDSINGVINITSKPGEGTSIEILLPLTD